MCNIFFSKQVCKMIIIRTVHMWTGFMWLRIETGGGVF
jgi:hypothetical protein